MFSGVSRRTDGSSSKGDGNQKKFTFISKSEKQFFKHFIGDDHQMPFI